MKGKKVGLVQVGSDKGRPKGWVGSGSGNARGCPGPKCYITIIVTKCLKIAVYFNLSPISV